MTRTRTTKPPKRALRADIDKKASFTPRPFGLATGPFNAEKGNTMEVEGQVVNKYWAIVNVKFDGVSVTQKDKNGVVTTAPGGEKDRFNIFLTDAELSDAYQPQQDANGNTIFVMDEAKWLLGCEDGHLYVTPRQLKNTESTAPKQEVAEEAGVGGLN